MEPAYKTAARYTWLKRNSHVWALALMLILYARLPLGVRQLSLTAVEGGRGPGIYALYHELAEHHGWGPGAGCGDLSAESLLPMLIWEGDRAGMADTPQCRAELLLRTD